MSGLKEIRNRISSVSSTMQITNAMKMVSAAKLKKAQDSISATLPYSNKLSELIKIFLPLQTPMILIPYLRKESQRIY